MTPVDALLEPGERVLARAGLHPVSLTGAAGFAAFTLLVTTLLIVNNDLPASSDLRILLGGLLVVALGFVRPLLRLSRTAFAVTDRRFLVRAGAVRLETLAIPLEGAQLAVERPHRLADAATLVVRVGDGFRAWGHVADAAALASAARRPRAGRGERRQTS